VLPEAADSSTPVSDDASSDVRTTIVRGAALTAGADRTQLPILTHPTGALDDAAAGVVRVFSHAPTQTPSGRSGTGWIVEPGIVVTSLHTLRGAETIAIRDMAGTAMLAEVIASDVADDLALLAVPRLTDPALAMDDVVDLGERVTMVGYPHGQFQRRTGEAAQVIQIYLESRDRTDTHVADGIAFNVAAAGGASGAPLINDSGEVTATVRAVNLNRVGESLASGEPMYDETYAVTNDAVRRLLAALDAARAPEVAVAAIRE
jgi:S1-C subfamily serine protease